jgi:F-type H+-transporting ATPase subunit gamma
MQGIREYNGKIASLRNTMKLTSSMKMISTVKMQRFAKLSASSDPWWMAARAMLLNAFPAIASSRPLFLDGHSSCSTSFIYVISADRGLCGRFNSAIMDVAQNLCDEIRSKGWECSLSLIGRKAARYFARRRAKISSSAEIGRAPDPLRLADSIANEAIRNFTGGSFHEIWMVHTKRLTSVLSKPVKTRILPLPNEALDGHGNPPGYDPLMESGRGDLADAATREFIRSYVHRALVESSVCEHNSRMMAMDSASSNCDRLIGEYTQKRNRARQSTITTEISEIISGKEALSD